MVVMMLLGLGAGLILAGFLLTVATYVYAKRIRSLELIRAMGISLALAGLVVMVIALG
jgi:hypothetical protein